MRQWITLLETALLGEASSKDVLYSAANGHIVFHAGRGGRHAHYAGNPALQRLFAAGVKPTDHSDASDVAKAPSSGKIGEAAMLGEASRPEYLYHGTSIGKARRIIANGPRTAGARTGTFGKAFYCSTKASGTRFYDKGAILVFRFKPTANVLSLNAHQRHGAGSADAAVGGPNPPDGEQEIAVFNPDALIFVGWYNKMTGSVDPQEPTYPKGFYHSWRFDETAMLGEASRITNSGEIGDLEHALNLWVEGKMAEAQPLLAKLAPVAAQFSNVKSPVLFRGFLFNQDSWQELRETKRLTVRTSPNEPLSSWSTSPKAVKDFMFGWEGPWAMLSKPTIELDIYINLMLFNRQARPFTQMHVQKEIIVKMPPTMTFEKSDLTIHDLKWLPKYWR